MATENNNKVGNNPSDSSDAPADLSYKSENIVGSKSRARKDAEFGETKLSPSEKVGQASKAFSDKLKSADPKKTNLILIVVIVLVGLACAIGIAFLIISNNPQGAEEGETDETAAVEETESDDAIAAARAEAGAALKNNPNDCTGAGRAYSSRINALIDRQDENKDETNGIADDLIDDAEEYFTEVNPSTCSLLAMYTDINYSDLSEEPDVYWHYKRIVELADELGDTETKAHWEPILNAAAEEIDFDDENDEIYEGEGVYDATIINNTPEGDTNE